MITWNYRFLKSGFINCRKKLGEKNETTNDEISKFIEDDFDYSRFLSDFNNILSQTYEGVVGQDFNFNELKNFNKNQNSERVAKSIITFLNNKYNK